MLLRDKKGPILQVVHYVNDHINIDDFHVGQMLRYYKLISYEINILFGIKTLCGL